MLVNCPVCQAEYDLEPGKYKCECGAEFLVEDPSTSLNTPNQEIDKTIFPRHDIDFDPKDDRTIPGKRDRKPDGYFEPGELILNRYKVLGSLGRGGMGVVYKCFDEIGGIEIALKALPPELSHDEDEMEDIKENFQIVAKLVHQNICISKNLEKDTATGNYYLIMEYVEGEDLRRWLRQKRNGGKISADTIISIIKQVADALDYAHSEGVIHRDIKPGNVIIDQHGKIKLLDFGLAAQIHSSMSRVSMAYHGTSGTAIYMAPEQWLGQAQDATADQYALAAMTYEMFAGRVPFEGNDTNILREAVLNAPPPRIENLPRYIQDALNKGLSKKPSDRFSNCAEFVSALTSRKKASIHLSQKQKSLILYSILIFACMDLLGYLGYLGYKKIKDIREKYRIEQARIKKEKEERIAEEKRREALRIAEERERAEQIKREKKLQREAHLLKLQRERDLRAAEVERQKQNQILAEKRREAEIAEEKRKNAIDKIYANMVNEISNAFDHAKKQSQVHYQELVDTKPGKIEALKKEKDKKIKVLRGKISAIQQQATKSISQQELDKKFPLYKRGDKVVVYSNRLGRVSGTLSSVSSNLIIVNGRQISMADIQKEHFLAYANEKARKDYEKRMESIFQQEIQTYESKIQRINDFFLKEGENIDLKIEKAKERVVQIEKNKYEALKELQSNRDKANREHAQVITPVDYKKIIANILANEDSSKEINEKEKNESVQKFKNDLYSFNSLVFFAPLENELSHLATGQKITTHGDISYTEIDGIRCAYLDGKSMISFGENHILGNSPCTMTIWAYSTSNDSSRETAFVIGRQAPHSKRSLLRHGQRLKFEAFGNSIYSSSILRNQWNFIAITCDGDQVCIYTNGHLVGSGYMKLNTLADHISVGAIYDVSGDATETWKGYLSHARIYNKCLSSQEISALASELMPKKGVYHINKSNNLSPATPPVYRRKYNYQRRIFPSNRLNNKRFN